MKKRKKKSRTRTRTTLQWINLINWFCMIFSILGMVFVSKNRNIIGCANPFRLPTFISNFRHCTYAFMRFPFTMRVNWYTFQERRKKSKAKCRKSRWRKQQENRSACVSVTVSLSMIIVCVFIAFKKEISVFSFVTVLFLENK